MLSWRNERRLLEILRGSIVGGFLSLLAVASSSSVRPLEREKPGYSKVSLGARSYAEARKGLPGVSSG